MNVILCDKCGAVIEQFDDVFLIELGRWMKGKEKTYELCESCYNALNTWLNIQNKDYNSHKMLN